VFHLSVARSEHGQARRPSSCSLSRHAPRGGEVQGQEEDGCRQHRLHVLGNDEAEKDDDLFAWDGGKVTASKVNDYLESFDITAKDLRGFHANREMQDRLKAIRSKGKKLPEDEKDREKILKKEFLKALDETAEAVGHEASTLRSQYLVPNMEEQYLSDGTVSDKLSS
jgi:hypothetical protein